MVKVLAVVGGDHHIHNWHQGNSLGRRVSRSLDSLRFALNKAREYQVPFILNGDLMHDKNNIDPKIFQSLKFMFDEFSDVEIILNSGNHEVPEDGVTTLIGFESENVRVVYKEPDAVYANSLAGVVFVVVPFAIDHGRRAKLFSDASLTEVGCATRILVTHYSTKGVKTTGDIVLNCDDFPSFEDFHPEGYAMVLLSDTHRQQSVGANGYHLGATHQNTHGEETFDCHWWAIVGDDEKDIPPSLVPIPYDYDVGVFVTVKNNNDEVPEAAVNVRLKIDAPPPSKLLHPRNNLPALCEDFLDSWLRKNPVASDDLRKKMLETLLHEVGQMQAGG